MKDFTVTPCEIRNWVVISSESCNHQFFSGLITTHLRNSHGVTAKNLYLELHISPNNDKKLGFTENMNVLWSRHKWIWAYNYC